MLENFTDVLFISEVTLNVYWKITKFDNEYTEFEDVLKCYSFEKPKVTRNVNT